MSKARCDKHDAYFSPEKDKWLESKCSDPDCTYCAERPKKPSEVHELKQFFDGTEDPEELLPKDVVRIDIEEREATEEEWLRAEEEWMSDTNTYEDDEFPF